MLSPSLTLGCGSWGGNAVSENVTIKQLINIKTIAERRENMLWFRAPEKVYIKKGCLPVALDELRTVYHKKRVFIVTGHHTFTSGALKPITVKLEEMGITFSTFFGVTPDPTLACAREGRGPDAGLPARLHHRRGRRLRNGRRKDHVGAV